MAAQVLHRLPLLAPARSHLGPPAGLPGLSKFLRVLGCGQTSGPEQVQRDRGRAGLATVAREPPSLLGSVRLVRDSAGTLLQRLHRPSDPDEKAFLQRLGRCSSSGQVLALAQSVEIPSDTAAAAVLHRVADLEQDGHALKDPAVLEKEALRSICLQLEQEAGQLTDGGLVSALLACTRLFLDPGSPLMLRLASEGRERLGRGQMSVEQLVLLGRATLALEGPDCPALEQLMEQIQKEEVDGWSSSDLAGVYRLLRAGPNQDGKYQELLNTMHGHALSLCSRMDPGEVSVVLEALAALEQKTAIPLILRLVQQAVQHVPRFSDEQLTAVLGALMYLNQSDQDLVEALEKRMPTMAFTSDPEVATKVMQFLAQWSILSTPICDAVAESFVYRADEYSTAQVAGQMVALGRLGYLSPNAADVFRKLESVLYARISRFQPETLLDLLHSCILVERFPANFVAKVFSSFFLQELPGIGVEPGVQAQLTQLYMTMLLECPFYKGPHLHHKYRVKSFLMCGPALETPVDTHLHHAVTSKLVDLLGSQRFFRSRILTPYCYTLDVELKLDEDGLVLPARQTQNVYKRIALCIDGAKRFTSGRRQLLGKEAIKQRHLRLLGYEVVQIPFYEYLELQTHASKVEYLHQKILPHSFRQSWPDTDPTA